MIDLASSCFHKVFLRAQLTPLFVLRKQHQMMVLLLYVDGKIITGHTSSLFDEFLLQLKSEFSITDLGQVHYFLGVQVQTLSSGLFLSQTRCATQILHQAGLTDCKPLSTLSPPYYSPTLYRGLVGSL